MGREIKRVAADFDWPLNINWKGYINPYRPIECKLCEGSGENAATKQLSDDWYDFARTGRRWCDKITQDEVAALMESGRLMEWTRRPRNKEQEELLKIQSKEGGSGYWLKDWNGYTPTADEINKAQKGGPLGGGHDSINKWICVKARAKRLGIYGDCSLCSGKGHYWCEEKYEKLWDKWKQIEPPEGDAYQVWQTVSEGSPISPPFLNPEDLAEWLCLQTEGWFTRNNSKQDWMKFILGPGWAPSMIMDSSGMHDGIGKI